MSVFKKHWNKSIKEKAIMPSIESEEIKCKTAHVINGVIPTETDYKYANKTCDCGRIIFIIYPCDCSNRTETLRSEQNPNYAG